VITKTCRSQDIVFTASKLFFNSTLHAQGQVIADTASCLKGLAYAYL